MRYLFGLMIFLVSTTTIADQCVSYNSLSDEAVLALARANKMGKCVLAWRGPGGNSADNVMKIEIHHQVTWSTPWDYNMWNEDDAFGSFFLSSSGTRAAIVLRDFAKSGACGN